MTGFELRDQGDGIVRFQGYASVTEAPYEVGSYVEIINRVRSAERSARIPTSFC